MARVGIDLDGPCYDFPGQFMDWAYGIALIDKPYPVPTIWNFYELLGLNREEFLNSCKNSIKAGWLFTKGDPVEGCKEGIKALRDAGHSIHYVTARHSLGKEVKAPTETWLIDHGLMTVFSPNLHFSLDKTAIETDYFLDDKLENYDALDAAGVKVYLWDAPWNQVDHYHEYMDPRRRVKSWKEFVDAVALHEHELERLVDVGRKNRQILDLSYEESLREEYEGPLRKKYEEIRVTSATGGQKGKKLARFSLIPKKALWKVAELYGAGAQKYDDWNWRKGYNYSLSMDALERHYALWCEGQTHDEETGCHHLAAVVFHCLSLMTFEEEHPEMDDRWKGDAA